MRKNLEKSLKRDEVLFKIIKKNLKRISYTNFNFKVKISKQKYVRREKKSTGSAARDNQKDYVTFPLLI